MINKIAKIWLSIIAMVSLGLILFGLYSIGKEDNTLAALLVICVITAWAIAVTGIDTNEISIGKSE